MSVFGFIFIYESRMFLLNLFFFQNYLRIFFANTLWIYICTKLMLIDANKRYRITRCYETSSCRYSTGSGKRNPLSRVPETHWRTQFKFGTNAIAIAEIVEKIDTLKKDFDTITQNLADTLVSKISSVKGYKSYDEASNDKDANAEKQDPFNAIPSA